VPQKLASRQVSGHKRAVAQWDSSTVPHFGVWPLANSFTVLQAAVSRRFSCFVCQISGYFSSILQSVHSVVISALNGMVHDGESDYAVLATSCGLGVWYWRRDWKVCRSSAVWILSLSCSVAKYCTYTPYRRRSIWSHSRYTQHAEGLWHMRRHEPVIVRSASSVVFTQNFLCFGDLCVDAASGKDQRGTEILGVIWVSRHFGPGQDTSDPRHF